jgi:transketolase
MIVAHTLKGKGLSAFEEDDTNRMHGKALDQDKVDKILAELDELYGIK